MNVIFMAKETPSSIKALQYLIQKDIIVRCAVIREGDTDLHKICIKHNIPICDENIMYQEWEEGILSNIDYIFSFYWKKIKKNILNIPMSGSINFHPGPLPEARGSGYHTAILEQWGYWGVTAHYMDEEFDTGDIIERKDFKIQDGIINRELVHLTHIQLAELFKELIDKLLLNCKLERVSQGAGQYYSIAQVEASKIIQGIESPEEIGRKIRAFWNPPYSGATIKIGEKYYTVIDDNILKYIYENTTKWIG